MHGNQYIAAFISNIGAFGFGTAVGWINGGGHEVIAKHYKIRQSMDEYKLTVLMLPLGAACFCIPVGALLHRYGCKVIMFLQVVPYFLGWILLINAKSFYMMYAARYLLGICGAANLIAVPIYNAEIARKKNRGSIVSLFYGALIYGFAFNYITAEYFGGDISNIACLLVVVLSPLVQLIPERPSYYILKGKTEKAKASLLWLRNNEQDVSVELKALSDTLGNKRNMKRSYFGQIHRKGNLRSWPRSVTILLLSAVTSSFIISCHMRDMLERIDLHAMDCVKYLCLSMCLGHLICFLLVDRWGRRPLLLISAGIMIFCSSYLFIWLMWSKDTTHRSTPIITLMTFVGFHAMGIGPVSILLYVEFIIEPVRPFGCAFVSTIYWLAASLLSINYVFSLSHQAMFLFLLIVCIANLIFIIIFIPETRYLNSTQIQVLLARLAFNEAHSSEESF